MPHHDRISMEAAMSFQNSRCFQVEEILLWCRSSGRRAKDAFVAWKGHLHPLSPGQTTGNCSRTRQSTCLKPFEADHIILSSYYLALSGVIPFPFSPGPWHREPRANRSINRFRAPSSVVSPRPLRETARVLTALRMHSLPRRWAFLHV
jgi:hypothetical protein